MNRRAFYHLLQRYSDGTCTEEEKKLVEQWYELLDDDHDPAVSQEEVKQIVGRLWPVIKEKTLPPSVTMPASPAVPKIPSLLRWTAAAAVIALIGLSVYWLVRPDSAFHNGEDGHLQPQLSHRINTRTTPDTVLLADQSRVILEPGARLYYPDSFAAGKREVYLEGNAYFEVTKNPQAPFYVYSNDIVTQVLGTSFFVKTDAATNNVEVSVRTGKVAVYEKETPAGDRISKAASAGVILKPNQKVIYTRNNGHFRTMLVDLPLPVVMANKQEEMVTELNFVFEETPLSRVLAQLEAAYHIEITIENEAVGKALFSGDIKGQNLFDQLEIICQAVQATYEVRGTRILVKGDSDNN